MFYSVLGRLVWFGATRLAKQKAGGNRIKVGAIVAVAGVVVAGAIAARVAGSNGDSGG